MEKITAELMAKLAAWKQAGNRSVEVKASFGDKDWVIWIYDASVDTGVFIHPADFGKDLDEMIAAVLADKRKRLAEQMAVLDQKIGGVA